MMHGYPKAQRSLLALCLGVFSMTAQAFDSGSTGVDGAFSPTVNTTVELPPSGIFNYTTVNIPTGVTVKFKKNVANTPVVILASGNVTIAGTLDVSGTNAASGGAAGDGNQGDDGQPGLGGPGGFDGGRGGMPGLKSGGGGQGPGGAEGGAFRANHGWYGGGGGSYGAKAANSRAVDYWGSLEFGGESGDAYGSSLIQPLIGGSGGGGGVGGNNFEGGGGGGGGAAILIGSSGTVNVTGSILGNGGNGGAFNGGENVGAGGGGSGGAIRIIATTISGNGAINAMGGARGTGIRDYDHGGTGSVGRIRLEAETITRTAGTSPAYTTDLPGTVFLAGIPTLKIVSVAGVTVPEVPTGNADVTLPADTANPVTVVFETTNVPVGNTVKLSVIPAYGATTSALSPALAGTTQSATASVSATLPAGPSVLQAQTTYTIVAALGDALSKYAENERVERITLVTALNGPALAYLETVSGKRFQASPEALAVVAAGS